jgi:hypothetical protein
VSFWSRILGRSKADIVPELRVYPTLTIPGTVPPAFECAPRSQIPVSAPTPRQFAGMPSGTQTKPKKKPRNRRRLDARSIATDVLAHVRSVGIDEVFSNPEMDEWIDDWCRVQGHGLGLVNHKEVRAAIKLLPGIRYELRRLLDDPIFRDLLSRNAIRFPRPPTRSWVFILPTVPEHQEALQEANRRAA